jgi:hypothetical protein
MGALHTEDTQDVYLGTFDIYMELNKGIGPWASGGGRREWEWCQAMEICLVAQMRSPR